MTLYNFETSTVAPFVWAPCALWIEAGNVGGGGGGGGLERDLKIIFVL